MILILIWNHLKYDFTQHWSFDAPSPGNPVNIRINLILRELRETRVIRQHFCLRYYGSIFIQILLLCCKNTLLFNRVGNGHSRSSEVVDFGTNQMRVCDVAGFLLKQRAHPYSPTSQPDGQTGRQLTIGFPRFALRASRGKSRVLTYELQMWMSETRTKMRNV